jgi:ATP-dependent Clp protease ATP-binding subunit ClpA
METPALFERYTEKSMKVMELAKEETWRRGHDLMGTEVILIGLIKEGTGIAAQSLKETGVSHARVMAIVEKIIGRGPGPTTMDMLFTPKAQRLLVLAINEADKMESRDIGTHHVLLGLIDQASGSSEMEAQGEVLQGLGVDLEVIRTKVFEIVKDYQDRGLKHPTKVLW